MSVNEIITVTSKDALLNAIKAKYVTIVIGGECAHEIAGLLRKNNIGNVASNLSIIAGFFFLPALFVGIGGKIFTHEIKKYEIIEVDEEFVTIKRKKK